MSKRRMFSQDIVESDAFLDMPLSTQGLYFHLCMNADDYGFVSPKRIMRMIGANDDDLKVLLIKRFVLGFDSGVVVIKAWQISNTVRKDRSHDTTYQEEFKSLTFNEFGAYTEIKNIAKTADEIAMIDSTLKNAVVNNNSGDVEILTTNMGNSKEWRSTGKPNDNQMTTEIRLDKIRLDKNKEKIYKKEVEKVPKENIDEMLTLWHERTGLVIGNEAANRKAVAALLRQIGHDKLCQLIEGVRLTLDDQYAPRISDFVSLKRKMNDLILWGRKKGRSHAIAQF